MPLNTVTTEASHSACYTTNHSHNGFAYGCNSTALVSTLSFSHDRLYCCIWDTKWILPTLSLGFVEPDYKVRSEDIKLAPTLLCYKVAYWFKLLGPIHQSFYFRRHFLGIFLCHKYSKPLKNCYYL